jgi:hypothetical protein
MSSLQATKECDAKSVKPLEYLLKKCRCSFQKKDLARKARPRSAWVAVSTGRTVVKSGTAVTPVSEKSWYQRTVSFTSFAISRIAIVVSSIARTRSSDYLQLYRK